MFRAGSMVAYGADEVAESSAYESAGRRKIERATGPGLSF